MPSTMNTPSPTATAQAGVAPTPRSLRPSRRMMARFATAATSTVAILAGLVVGGSSAAWAAGARFVPEDTDAGWDGAVATVVFREVGVDDAEGVTTISVKVTAAVDVVCRRGESKLNIHRSASALEVDEYPVRSGTVTGTAEVPLVVPGLKVSGFSCAVQHVVITTVLDDFQTGATLTHRS